MGVKPYLRARCPVLAALVHLWTLPDPSWRRLWLYRRAPSSQRYNLESFWRSRSRSAYRMPDGLRWLMHRYPSPWNEPA